MADVSFTYFTVGDAVIGDSRRVPVSVNGDWTATIPILHDYSGPGGFSASCGVPGQAPDFYATAPFSVSTLGAGYWLLTTTPVRASCFCTTTANILSFGDASDYGPRPSMQSLVGIAPNEVTGAGYWLATSDGGVFAFGDAAFYGSAAPLHLNRPIIGIAATPTGHGYWLTASDGGVFAFGDATFRGSAAPLHLNRPIIGIAATPTGRGYRMATSAGDIYNFGDARSYGTCNETCGTSSVLAIANTPLTQEH